MKKLITAVVLVAFAGAVAFASLQGNSKEVTSKEKKQQQKEVKKTEKKKVKKHSCPFS